MKLYNTLTKKVEEFVPQKPGHVNMYTCGPTVYNYAHIGNLRSYIMADLLFRTLKFNDLKVHWVMNITDIDDKTIKGTIAKYGKEAGVKELYEYTKFYLDEFKKDLKEVNVSVDEIDIIRVTDKMKEIQEFILELIDKGYAYKTEDGVYFSIEKYQKDFGDYGQLVGEKFLEGKKVGARVAVDEYEKEDLSDFALWKNHNPETDANIFWSHPKLGNGHPGWHIECSVINRVVFNGEPTDIHTGGVDLIFPHHTNEIAQSQPFYKPFSRFWYHNEHLLVDGGRMGKRFNNFYTIKDLKEKGFSGQDLRYFFLNSSFTSQQNFTLEGLSGSKSALNKLFNYIHPVFEDKIDVNGKIIDKYKKIFIEEIKNNLSIPSALALTWKIKSTNELNISESDKITTLIDFDKVFGFGLLNPPAFNADEDQVLLGVLKSDRILAKQQKDFKKSDELRKQIEDLGYEVMDTPEGQKVKKKLQI